MQFLNEVNWANVTSIQIGGVWHDVAPGSLRLFGTSGIEFGSLRNHGVPIVVPGTAIEAVKSASTEFGTLLDPYAIMLQKTADPEPAATAKRKASKAESAPAATE